MALLALLSFVVVIPTAVIIDGWVLTKLWAWFIVPTFSLPSLGIVPAIGLSLVVAFLIHGVMPDRKSNEDEDKTLALAIALGKLVFVPLFYLLFGWIVSSFM